MGSRKTLRLVKRAMRGNDSAFLELMEIKQKDLLYIAIQIMRNKQDGEDAAQEAALVIRQNIQGLRNAEAFTVWMYKIVHTVCMNIKRNMKLSTVDIDEMESRTLPLEDRREFLPSEYALDKELRKEVLNSLDKLPEKQRISILLFYYEGLKYNEIAEVMGTNIQDVANSLGRGRKKLKELLIVDGVIPEKAETKNQIGALPVVALILKEDAEEMITPEMCRAFTGKLAATIGAAGKASTSVLTMTKVAASVIAGLTLAAGGITALSFMNQEGSELVQQVEQDDYSASTKSDDSKNGEDREALDEDIATLALPSDTTDDGASSGRTVGDEYDRFVDSGQTEDGWNDLVDAVKAQYFTHIVGTQYRFDVYRVPVESTQQSLVMIARIDDEGRVELAFGKVADQDIPRQKDIIRAFEEWRK